MALIDDSGAATGQITDHCTEGLSFRTSRWLDKPRFEALLCAYLDQCQTLEDTWWALYTERGIDTAVGAQLNILGDIVGAPRAGRTDDEYRAYIRGVIAANRSLGKASSIARVWVAVTGEGPRITDYYPASSLVGGYGLTDAEVDAFRDLMSRAKAAGVALLWYYSRDVEADTLRWGSTTGSVSDTGIIGTTTGSVTGDPMGGVASG